MLPDWTNRSEFGSGQFTWRGNSIPLQLLNTSFSVNTDNIAAVTYCHTQLYICFSAIKTTKNLFVKNNQHHCSLTRCNVSNGTFKIWLTSNESKSSRCILFVINSADCTIYQLDTNSNVTEKYVTVQIVHWWVVSSNVPPRPHSPLTLCGAD